MALGTSIGRTIIVGDVHGCSDELDALLDKVAYRSADRLIFVGDLICKGPDSLGVLRRAWTLNAEMVLGNHEQSFLRACRRGVFGRHTKAVRLQMGTDVSRWATWIESWPTYIDGGSFWVVHAGVVPGRHPKDMPRRWLTRIRTWDGRGECLDAPDQPAWFEGYHDPRLVVFGHWAQRGLVVRPNAIGLDSGCVYGGELTALILPDRTLVQVPAKKAYCPISPN